MTMTIGKVHLITSECRKLVPLCVIILVTYYKAYKERERK